ncbi:unnamed protein product [Closterium sp. Naga37s-1]|nr:unnamed protein product [Closterium sp. Naga37s-1]
MAAPAVSLVSYSSTQAAFVSRVVACQSRATSSQQQFPSPPHVTRVAASSFTRATTFPSRTHSPCVSRSLRSRQLTTGWPYGCRVAAANAGTTIVASASVGDVNEAIKDAAKEGDVAAVKLLLAGGGVDINLPSPERSGWTALHLAAFYEHPEVVQVLLTAGADTDARNSTGNTPLQFACIKGNLDVARMLLDAGADLYATSDDKGNALEYAQEWGTEEMVDFLLIRAATERNK